MYPVNYLLYQAYGHQDIIHEALYSILSFLKTKEQGLHKYVQVMVYTDQPESFAKVLGQRTDIKYEQILPALIREWRGEMDFVHRVKINVLMDFFVKHSANVIYVDTDTVITGDLDKYYRAVESGTFVMHEYEGRIEEKRNRIAHKMAQGLKHSVFNTPEKAGFSIPLSTKMWNAGTIGISADRKGLLEEVLLITDQAYGQNPMHISEQFAFSYVLQNHGKVKEATDAIFHYWNFKEFRGVLAQFFEHYKGADMQKLLKAMDEIAPQKLIKPKLEYEGLSKIGRFLRRLKGEKWKMPDYKLS